MLSCQLLFTPAGMLKEFLVSLARAKTSLSSHILLFLVSRPAVPFLFPRDRDRDHQCLLMIIAPLFSALNQLWGPSFA